MAYVSVTCADGRPIQELAKLIEQRSKWLKETAEQSCAACMIDVLVSLRALTLVAKPKKSEIVMSETSYTPSYTTIAKSKRQLCLRIGRARYFPAKNERIVSTTNFIYGCKVYDWVDINNRCWLIIAPSQKDAIEWAYEKMKKRAQKFKGLARTALSKLMMLSGTKTAQRMDNQDAANKAQQVTSVTKTGNGASFSITAHDMLDYAKLALRGGDAAINQALGKASNKIAATINQKCKNLLLFEKLETPFPELRSRK